MELLFRDFLFQEEHKKLSWMPGENEESPEMKFLDAFKKAAEEQGMEAITSRLGSRGISDYKILHYYYSNIVPDTNVGNTIDIFWGNHLIRNVPTFIDEMRDKLERMGLERAHQGLGLGANPSRQRQTFRRGYTTVNHKTWERPERTTIGPRASLAGVDYTADRAIGSVPQEIVQQVFDLYKQGYSDSYIAKNLGLTHQQVYSVLWSRGGPFYQAKRQVLKNIRTPLGQ